MGAVPACEAVQYYMLLLVATLAKFPHLHVTSEILYLDSTRCQRYFISEINASNISYTARQTLNSFLLPALSVLYPHSIVFSFEEIVSVFAQQPRNETFSFMTNNVLFTAESVSWIATCMYFFYRKSMSKAGLMYSFQFTK